MDYNWYLLFVTALVPLVMGFIWYNTKVFGKAWMAAADMTEDKMKGANMGLIFGLTYLMGLLASLSLGGMVIHQGHMASVLMNEPGFMEEGSEIHTYFTEFMNKYGSNFRTFKHGAFHGTLVGLLFFTPLFTINALFERKSFKYIAINAGFWIVCLILMGGIICAWL